MKVSIVTKLLDTTTLYQIDDAILVESDNNDYVSIIQIVCADPYYENGKQTKERILRVSRNSIVSLTIK